MASLLRTLIAFLTGAAAAMMWLDRQTRPEPSRPAPVQPPPAKPEPEPIVEQVIEFAFAEVHVPDPAQAARIAELEAELEQQRAVRVAPPAEPPPSVDALRAARAHAYELERRLEGADGAAPIRWSERDVPAAAELPDAAAEHLPRVALHSVSDSVDSAALWAALGAMQAFAEACRGEQAVWFEFHGDFARWCAESGHPDALGPDRCGHDESHPAFAVAAQVNRSGRLVVPTYVQVGEQRVHYVDDVAGETGRMHVVGARQHPE